MLLKDEWNRAIALGYWVSKHPGNRWYVGRDSNPAKLAGPFPTKTDARRVMLQLAGASQRLIDLADKKV